MMKFTYFLILIAACLVIQSTAYPFPEPDPEPVPDDAVPATACEECKAEETPTAKPDPTKCPAESEACTKWNAANDGDKVECACVSGGGGEPTTAPDGTSAEPGEPSPTETPVAVKCNVEDYCKDVAKENDIMENKCTEKSIACLTASDANKAKCTCKPEKCDADGSDCLDANAGMIVDVNWCTKGSAGCVKAGFTNCTCGDNTPAPPPGPPGPSPSGKGDGASPSMTTPVAGGETTAGSTRTTATQLFVLVNSFLSFLLFK